MKKLQLALATLILFLVCGASTQAYCQKKPFTFEAGLTYSFSPKKDGFERSKVWAYLNGTYRLKESPISVGAMLSLEQYTSVQNVSWKIEEKPGLVTIEKGTIAYEGRSLAFIPYARYNFDVKTIKPYVGMGLGLSADNFGTGVFNSGGTIHIAAAPEVGVRLFDRLSIFAKYYISHKNTSRCLVGVGYIF